MFKSKCTGCKGNKCHPFNSIRGRLIGPKKIYSIYNIGSKFYSFLEKKNEFIFLFCSRRAAYIFGDNAKTFTSVVLSFKYEILFAKEFTSI